MWNKIYRWLYWHRIIKCKHDWVPARQFYKEYEGKDYEFLEPSPMKYHPEYQSAGYICRKCHDTIVTIEAIEDRKPLGVVK